MRLGDGPLADYFRPLTGNIQDGAAESPRSFSAIQDDIYLSSQRLENLCN